ncbi:NAD(P)H-quinone oxidoreductase [Magnetospira sp. QH-2]|uniref:NAD(P)H-quinone oxidoreductase n=1 Tax=Magnetospira sp. (strain QH-2) TaxID=1288970 RepID=UPI0003E819DD|nr:NAD(P)H-quinone oxidoreductase [Magnetospira sp. QH-2]CCQ74358.1 putative NADPH quinone oxidoreductase [Magnetospira sp. QH-2]
MTLSLPDQMTCMEITEPGDADVLRLATRPLPKPGPGDVLIQVAAAGINRPDVLQRMGRYAPPADASDLPGLEVSGRVVALGEAALGIRPGSEVCALAPGGGYAEYCVVPADHCLPVPEKLDLIQAAALPETFFTVWSNVFERGNLTPNEHFLIHGGSSGIGTTAIQLASRLGAKVMATAGSDEKCQACLDLGAERAINYHQSDFVAAAKEWTDKKGVDVILDMVGGDYVSRNLKALGVEGRLIHIAFLGGSKVELDLMPMMLKRQTITGSTLRPQSVERKAEIAESLRKTVWPLIEAGEVKPVIHATFPLSQAAEAHRLMESNQHIGKIVLTMDQAI